MQATQLLTWSDGMSSLSSARLGLRRGKRRPMDVKELSGAWRCGREASNLRARLCTPVRSHRPLSLVAVRRAAVRDVFADDAGPGSRRVHFGGR